MSARLGTPNPQYILTAVAPTAAGAVLVLGPNALAICSIMATWVASATINPRTVQIQIKDGAGNILLRLPALTGITAGQTVLLLALTGAAFANFAGPPIVQTLALPVDLPVPANSSITFVDTSNIDGAGDRVSAAVATSA